VRDSESVYGGPAVAALLSAADLGRCSSVFEFGCGSARLAARLLRPGGELSKPGAGVRYVGVDVSPVSLEMARERLKVRQRVRGWVVLHCRSPLHANSGHTPPTVTNH